MLLHNLRLSDSGPPQSMLIEAGFIKAIAPAGYPPAAALILNFSEAFAFPGLINSHDHLDFNSFPLLGNRPYPNYVAWGIDIHAHHKELIDRVRRIPRNLRVQWGMYKNLINGITTVVHHGPPLTVPDPLISVYQNCYSLHSVGLEKNWRLKLNGPWRGGRPFVIHIGEGTDAVSRQEIDSLIRWNIFRRPLIGVHGVAMSARQAGRFLALVWCPDSNLFLLGKTAAIPELKAHTQVVFGTDSTLTGSWNLWDQLRLAKASGMASSQELLAMLTTTPAQVWHLPHLGRLAPGRQADIVVARQKHLPHLADSFQALHPADILLVMHQGEIKLFDASLYAQIKKLYRRSTDFSSIRIGDATKFVKGQLPALMQAMAGYCPGISFPVSY
jgi:hypothetical protein